MVEKRIYTHIRVLVQSFFFFIFIQRGHLTHTRIYTKNAQAHATHDLRTTIFVSGITKWRNRSLKVAMISSSQPPVLRTISANHPSLSEWPKE